MLKFVKSGVKKAFGHLGFQIRRISPPGRNFGEYGGQVLHVDPFCDIKAMLTRRVTPIIFDVGANIGQTIVKFREQLPASRIHAFEPGMETFKELSVRMNKVPGLILNNSALGSTNGTASFFEYNSPVMSSFFPPGTSHWGKIEKIIPVVVETLDAYCQRASVSHIDVLKIDTEGFDLEIIRGGHRMLSENRANLILTEILFSDLYQGAPRFDKLYGFLADCGFKLVTFYEQYYVDNVLGWTDALFLNDKFKPAQPEPVN